MYYDLALAAGDQALAALMTVADPMKVLYGSDYPFSPESAVRENIIALDSSAQLPDDVRRDIGRTNAPFACSPACSRNTEQRSDLCLRRGHCGQRR